MCVRRAASKEVGVTRHGLGLPILAKHSINLDPPSPGDKPELVCEICGHEEDFPWGSQYSLKFVDKQYLAARERLETHVCGRPGQDVNLTRP
jgi:hypothetical protein